MSAAVRAFAVACISLFPAQAQYAISTYAGGGPPAGGTATMISVGEDGGVTADSFGNFYVASRTQYQVFKIDAAGRTTVVAGNGLYGNFGDGGQAVNAAFVGMSGLAVDASKNYLYIADGGSVVRRVDLSTGIVSRYVGTGATGYSGDFGDATNAQLNLPKGLALDSSGNLFIADSQNHVIRRVDFFTGIITTVAGNGAFGYSGDGGSARFARLAYPAAVAVDGAGNFFISDTSNNRIRRVGSAGTITTIVNTDGSFGFSGDGGTATRAQIINPEGIAVDGAGNLYFSDRGNERLRRVTSDGVISTIAGTGSCGFSGDGGISTSASLCAPTFVTVDTGGTLYVRDSENFRVRKVAGTISSVAGNGHAYYSGEGRPALSAQLRYVASVAVDAAGIVHIAENARPYIGVSPDGIRRVVSNSIFTTSISGVVSQGHIALDTTGHIYLSDSYSNRIFRVAGTLQAEPFAGTGGYGYSSEPGSAINALFNGVAGIAIDGANSLLIVDRLNHRVRKVAGGFITTIAGNGTGAFSGDGGLATAASLSAPSHVAVDPAGNIYIADGNNYRIRKIDVSNGRISTVAGNGIPGVSADGVVAITNPILFVSGLAADAAGNVYFSEPCQVRVVKANGILSTAAGTGFCGFSGDGGPATSARLNPSNLAIDKAGNIYVADFLRVRRLTPAYAVTTNPPGLQITVDGATLTAPQTFNWLPGTQHTISTASPQGTGTRNVFANWSDGLAQTHTVTAPSTPTTYTANFTTQHLVTTSVSPTGGGTVTPVTGYVNAGTNQQFSATANSGFTFASWSGDLTGPTNPQSRIVDRPLTVTANFTALTGITVTTNPPGLQITVDSVSLTSPQTFNWLLGTQHTISTASPQGSGTRNVFANWSDGLAQTHTVTAPSTPTTYTANFTTQHLMTTAVAPSGGGTVTPVTGYVAAGTNQSFSATANSGFTFGSWSGDLTGTTNPQSRIVDRPLNVTANFTSLTGITVNTSPPGLQITVDSVILTAPQAFNWTPGTQHTISTTSPQGTGTRNVFANWSDGGLQTHTVTAPSTPTTYTANFTTQHLVTTSVSPAGGGTVTPVTGYVNAGTNQSFSATANTGFTFGSWSGDLTGTTNPQSRIVDRPLTVTANFTALTTVTTSPPGLQITVDSVILTAPRVFNWVPGTTHTISTTSPQGSGTRNVFANWSDGGIQTHTVTAPSTPTTYTANFTTQHLVTTSGAPSGGGTVTPVTGYVNAGTNQSFSATANSGFLFASWSGDLTGTTNPQSRIVDRPLTVTGIFATDCPSSLSAPSAAFGSAGGAGSFTLAVTAGCAWSVTGVPAWVTNVFPSTGSGTATINYTVLPNTSSNPRSQTLTIAGLPYLITQAGVPCTFGLSPGSASLPASGGTIDVTVTASAPDCPWNVTNVAPWFSIALGTGTVRIVVQSNPSVSSRTGVPIIAGLPFTISQAGISCTYSMPQGGASFLASGGSGSATIATPTGCGWTASSSATWLTFTSSASGSGTGGVAYNVASNSATVPRSATITFTGPASTPPFSGTYRIDQPAGNVPPPLSCSASALPRAVAGEGRTELVGELVLSCTGQTAASSGDLVLSLNTNVTNRTSSTDPDSTDAQLRVNNGATTINGRLAGSNLLRWSGVPLTQIGGALTLRISNVLADASLLGGSLQAAVIGTASLTAGSAVVVQNAQQTLATAATTLSFRRGTPSPPSGGPQTFVPMFFQETIPGGFKAVSPASRVLVRVQNVPANVQVFAPVTPLEGNRAQLMSANASGIGGSPVTGSPRAGGMYHLLALTGGIGTATWEVTAADAAQLETQTFQLLLENATAGDLNAIQVAGVIGPISDVSVASATAPIPRYRDTSVALRLVNLRITSTTESAAVSAPIRLNWISERLAAIISRDADIGSSITFIHRILNDSAEDEAPEVVVRDNLSAALIFQSCTRSDGVPCSASGNDVRINFGPIGPGGTRELRITVRLSSTEASSIENTASVSSSIADSELASNQSSIFVVVEPPTITECRYTITPTEVTLPVNGANGTITVTPSRPGCPWTPTTEAHWLNITNGGQRTDSGTISYSVGANLGSYPRAAVVRITAGAFVVIQQPAQCEFTFSAPGTTIPPVGGFYNVEVTPSQAIGSACPWNARSNMPWIRVVGAGNNILDYVVDPNNSGVVRYAELLVAERTYRVTQYAINNTGKTPPEANTVAPFVGSGSNQLFTLDYSDKEGYTDINTAEVRFGVPPGCSVEYNRTTNRFRLNDDSGQWSAAVAPGQPVVLTNSQCSLDVAGSSTTGAGNALTVRAALIFKPIFSGKKNVYLRATDIGGQTSDWMLLGIWYTTPVPGTLVNRYRVFNPRTLGHVHTTDCYEYGILGLFDMTQEGPTGALYDNLTTVNGVQTIPFFRVLNLISGRHLWTTDRNEYLTLIRFKNLFSGEGVDGFLLPTQLPGSIPLYRLLYTPFGPSAPPLHNWTTDTNEYQVLPSYGWKQEGIVGYMMPPVAASCPPVSVQSAKPPTE